MTSDTRSSNSWWPAVHLAAVISLASLLGTRSAFAGAPERHGQTDQPRARSAPNAPFVVVLGIAQDGGYPQAGCQKGCCAPAWADPAKRRYATCLAIVDPVSDQRWLIECTPDFRDQLKLLDRIALSAARTKRPSISGILLTHAHIGHYAGLVHLGREVMGTRNIPVHAMPRMRKFLETNGPWSQLVRLHNIELRDLVAGKSLELNDRIRIKPIIVPHRDEYSETIGFHIAGPERSVLFIPDIDKWDRWRENVGALIAASDIALLDGTFYDSTELPGRDMSEIPHPFIVESVKRFAALPPAERRKVHFLHLNHTNPALDAASDATRRIRRAGLNVARQGARFEL